MWSLVPAERGLGLRPRSVGGGVRCSPKQLSRLNVSFTDDLFHCGFLLAVSFNKSGGGQRDVEGCRREAPDAFALFSTSLSAFSEAFIVIIELLSESDIYLDNSAFQWFVWQKKVRKNVAQSLSNMRNVLFVPVFS